MVKLLGSYNEYVKNVFLDNAPQNAQYITPRIQKEILHVIAKKVRCAIQKEIVDSKFCILVYESRDELTREQMERNCSRTIFNLVHDVDTFALTLKIEISSILSRHDLCIHNLRGQGYDGASNMQSENGLQALFLKDCPYAYYVHCFAH
ncbi:LOW QUALITY PROTEIN: DUF4371 domain-containing protein, partial [Cephalotus follicularis]